MAEIISVLFFHVMRYDPNDPRNPAADRFVLSKVSETEWFRWSIYSVLGPLCSYTLCCMG